MDTVDEAARLHALQELRVLDTPPEERFDRVTRLCQRVFGVEIALVSLIDKDRQWFKSRQGLAVPETPRDIAFCNLAIQQSNVFIVEDARADERFRENPLVAGDPNIRFYAGMPIEARGGHRVGTLCIIDPEPRKLTALEVGLLEDLALWVQNELVIDEELERAAEVQQGLLPRRELDLPGYEVAARVKSSWLVGGDFFDWFSTAGGGVICVADVMGKGMGGAILMATVRAVLRGAAGQASLADGVSFASSALADDLESTNSFFTLFIGRAQPNSNKLSYVDAGHGLAFVARQDGSVERLTHRGLPVGMLPDSQWSEAEVDLEPGDALVVCSDGVIDVDGDAESDDDIDRVFRKVADLTMELHDPQRVVDAVTDVAIQPDDVTILVLRRT